MFMVYTGLRGSGKSYAATRFVKEALNKNRSVWTNYALDFSGYGDTVPCQKCFRADSVADLADMRGEDFVEKKGFKKMGLFVYDESVAELFSRDWKTLDKPTVECYRQSRKIGMDVILITQDFADLDTSFRRIVDIIREFHRIWIFHWYCDYLPRDVDKATRKNVGWGFFFRSQKLAECYDSWALFGSLVGTHRTRTWNANGIRRV